MKEKNQTEFKLHSPKKCVNNFFVKNLYSQIFSENNFM